MLLPLLFYLPWAATVYGSPSLGFYMTTGFVLYHYSQKKRIMEQLGDDPGIIFGHFKGKDGETQNLGETEGSPGKGKSETEKDASPEEKEMLNPYVWKTSSWTYPD